MEPPTTPEDCCVKVAVHIRPLIGDEKLQACQDCVSVVPGKPQVQLGTHSFTFDHVYGSTATPSSSMFEECVAPLVDGLFQGYNATVLAYGQTGSGKTYTMGSGCKDGSQTGLIPQAMNALFNKIESLKDQIEFQLHVSFIEILKEEVRDLLDPNSSNKSETPNGQTGKVNIPGKPPIQIRENSNGVITLAGSTECSVQTLKEMADCLEHGSLSRATGSTNMNNQSSRSHAIFTITVEQIRKTNSGDNSLNESMGDEYLCAKLHLVDLAGSERAKRTGSDGMRFKEGVHINKGLLALGNVISALGDEKKRKEGAHVPYRDSKLTRLLQDSLGGNSRTVMIACVSPADINAEETLNTLKYANRARNIQNKPVVNRDPMSSEMLRMRQQLECLQAELCARGGGSPVELQALRERISWLEATNQDLCRELHLYRSRGIAIHHSEMNDNQVDDSFCMENEVLRKSVDSSLQPPPPQPPPINNQPTNIMGNCQAIDNASLIIQHPNGKVERLYTTITAAEVMKLNPGHYVALLLTTTLYSSRPPSTTVPTKQNNTGATVTTSGQPLRITRIKLLRPTESLTVGHIYRLITTQEVMKGLMAKKNGKVSDYMKKPVPVVTEELAGKNIPAAIRSNQSERTHQQMKRSEKDRKTAAAMKARGWHPSLNSISEASS